MIGKLRLLFWLGIIMIFLSFLGIPNTWKMIMAILIGIALIIISFSLRKKYRSLRLVIRNLERSVPEKNLHE